MSARAVLYQAQGLYEKSLDDWMECRHFNKAHEVFMKRIAPLYFNHPVVYSRQLFEIADKKALLLDFLEKLKK